MKTNDLILLGAGFAAGRLSNKMQAGPIGAVNTDWQKYISPFIKKTDKQFKTLQKEFNNELRRLKINPEKDIDKSNLLWRSKYADRFKQLEKKHDLEYKKLWNNFHKK